MYLLYAIQICILTTTDSFFVASFASVVAASFVSFSNPVAAFNEHRNWVVSVHLNGTREAVSGSISGDVRFWDLRMSESIR